MPNIFRNLPSVSELLEHPQLKQMVDRASHNFVVDGARKFLDDFRQQVKDATDDIRVPTPNEMASQIADWLTDRDKPYLRPVINATGIVLHTGLGRAPLANEAQDAVREISQGYASVEIDAATGERGQRVKAVERLLCELTGAEAAVVVNNNAAATMLTLAAMAKGKQVIVSRGQLIEIGGSYRLPDVMECSGAVLKEVGTTNKTRPSDYENAINEETGGLLKVHPSNYEIVGFTQTVSTKDMVAIGKRHGTPVIDDVGSGALIDFRQFGLMDEPVVRDSISDGADLVLFSGDKLIGGPQCGIVVGKAKYIQRLLEDSLMRAFRVGKMTLAALAATLRLYRDVDQAKQSVPILRMLSMPLDNLKLRADKLVTQIAHLKCLATCEAVEDQSMLGGGSLPTQKFATWCVAVTPSEGSVNRLADRIRQVKTPILGRVAKDRLLLDLRTIQVGDDTQVVEAFESLDQS
ncbi:MAG: L-seryl-tRNA(Sec) selenium transferase [Planctomycetota bacterium]